MGPHRFRVATASGLSTMGQALGSKDGNAKRVTPETVEEEEDELPKDTLSGLVTDVLKGQGLRGSTREEDVGGGGRIMHVWLQAGGKRRGLVLPM